MTNSEENLDRIQHDDMRPTNLRANMSVMWMSSSQKAFFTQKSSEFNLFHFKVQYCIHADRPDKTDPHLESSNSLQHLYNATLLLMLTKDGYRHLLNTRDSICFLLLAAICRFTTKCISVSCTRMVSPGSCIPEIRKHCMLETIKQPCPLDNAQHG